MESTEELLKKFRKRDLTAESDPVPKPPVSSKEAQFVKIRRKGLAADTDLEAEVSQEALIDEEGVVGLGG